MCVCKLAPFQFVWHSFSVSWTQASIIDREVKTIFHLQVLSCVLDPLLQMCTVSASNLGTADMATFMVNSLYMMKTTLALFEFTDRRLEMLQFQVRFALKWLLTAMESLFCMWPQLTGFDLIPLNPLLSDGRPHTCTHTPACTHVQYSLLVWRSQYAMGETWRSDRGMRWWTKLFRWVWVARCGRGPGLWTVGDAPVSSCASRAGRCRERRVFTVYKPVLGRTLQFVILVTLVLRPNAVT